MIDWETLCDCHRKVPVRYWPVLWFYLACLRITLKEAWAEGRDGVAWALKPNGVIYIRYWGESTAERAERGGLPHGFDRAPWTRHAPGLWACHLPHHAEHPGASLLRLHAVATLLGGARLRATCSGGGSLFSLLPHFSTPCLHPP